MASDVAQTPQLTNGDAVGDAYQSALHSHHTESQEAQTASNDRPSTPANPSTQTETTLNLKEAVLPAVDSVTAAPVAVADMTNGIQPSPDLGVKDNSTHSHPTPPPDDLPSAVTQDVEMTDANGASGEIAAPETPHAPVAAISATSTTLPAAAPPAHAPVESSLVRPRDDDEGDEPAAKRNKVDGDDDVRSEQQKPSNMDSTTLPAPTLLPAGESSETPVPSSFEAGADSMKVEPGDSLPDSTLPAVSQPEPSSTPLVPTATAETSSAPSVVNGSTTEVAAPPPGPAPKTEGVSELKSSIEIPNGAPPSLPAVQDSAQSNMDPVTAKYDARPLTPAQKSILIERMKNLKKTKNSVAFLKPVDPIALNIPNYSDIIKNPMDLTTMENNLRDGVYTSVRHFAQDFDLIITNTRRFNGDAHPVTIAGQSMAAYFRRMMETVPSADSAAPPPTVPKKRSPQGTRERRRESRNIAPPVNTSTPTAPAPPPPAASPTTYALNNDGTPLIRRDSNRPQRAIKPPQNREITYAKPKRKEHQLELRFCEYVLEEVRSTRYGQLNHVFLQPVDPVALNIPQYRQIVKHPMDLATMSQKLKGGQYSTASEFKKDFDLMIKNCLLFNPAGNVVRDLGIQFQREFEALWATKGKWERQNQPASNRASSASVAEDSGEEEEYESDAVEDEKDEKATIRQLKKQLAEMQNMLSGLDGAKLGKTKKPKPAKPSKKANASAPGKTKAAAKPSKPKKVRQVTYEEKQEISEAVGNMNEAQVNRLTQIITTNCEKYRDMEEMELEIDDLPNDVQAKLLEYVRSIFGKPKKSTRDLSPDDAAAIDDDDFEPDHRGRGGGAGRRKKHKPMGKKEQTDTIKTLEAKLAQFSNLGTSGSESPTASSFNAAHAQAESSGDDESEESEEE